MISNLQFKNLAKRFGTPLYVYDVSVIERQWKALKSAIKYEPHQIYYAEKANSNLHILKLIKKLGAYLDVASPVEIYLGLKAGFSSEEMSFTGLNLSKEELEYVLRKGIVINADSLSQLEAIGKLRRGTRVGIRINPVFGVGYHEKVITAGLQSKFGIYYKEIDKVKSIAKKYNLKIIGLHQHIGSGILQVNDFLKAIDIMLGVAKHFNGLEYIDFGGGFGIPYKHTSNERPLDVKLLGQELSKKFEKFTDKYLSASTLGSGRRQAGGRRLELRLEPGRFLIAQSGTLLISVTAIKKNPAGDIVVGTNSGMTHMIRHALYGSFHEIENISNPKGRKQKITIVGNICESSDVFAKDRVLPFVREGDILALRDTGAYGFSMASRFNGQFLPAEVLVYPVRSREGTPSHTSSLRGKQRVSASNEVGGRQVKLIRHRDTFENFLPR